MKTNEATIQTSPTVTIKAPTPVFSIPAAEADKEYIRLQSQRTGQSQKDLIALAVDAGRKYINGLPRYTPPEVNVQIKVARATAAELALAGK